MLRATHRGAFTHVHFSACSAKQGPHRNGAPHEDHKILVLSSMSSLVHVNLMKIQNYCLQIRFLCSEWFQNAFNPAGGAYSAPADPLAGGEGARCLSQVKFCRLSMKWQLRVWVWRQSVNKVILGTVRGSSKPINAIIVLGAPGAPHFFLIRALFRVNPELGTQPTTCLQLDWPVPCHSTILPVVHIVQLAHYVSWPVLD